MITSAQNNRIKLVRALLTQSKIRRSEGRVVLEGVRLVSDVLTQGWLPDFVLHKPDAESSVLAQIRQSGVECLAVEPHIFDSLSDTQTSQGILAVVAQPTAAIPDDAALLLALDGLRDPGNVGTILRTAAAAGVDGVLLMPGTVDPYNPKVVRAGMGAHFRLPIVNTNWQTISDTLIPQGWRVWCADASMPGAVSYLDVDWGERCLLTIGGEARGLSDEARQAAHGFVFIPMARQVESLNSPAAAAVLLFDIHRRRGEHGTTHKD